MAEPVPIPMDIDKPQVIPFHICDYYYSAFTQSHTCSAPILIYDKMFSSSEAATMYAKACLFPENEDIKQQILASKNPDESKRLGRMVRNFNQGVWDAKKFEIVVACNVAKFRYNIKLLLHLNRTNDAILVYASPNDNIWGAGISHTHPDINDPDKWPGQNLLGKALMKTREILINGTKWP